MVNMTSHIRKRSEIENRLAVARGKANDRAISAQTRLVYQREIRVLRWVLNEIPY